MKARHLQYANKGATNMHDQSGKGGGVCPKCKTVVPPKPGYRLSSLKCPKCAAPLGK